MPAEANVEAGACRHEGGRRALELHRVARSRIQGVQLGERVEAVEHRVAMRAQPVGELAQDALHFLRLLALQLANAVPVLDRGGRLDEQRTARARGTVHDAADLT